MTALCRLVFLQGNWYVFPGCCKATVVHTSVEHKKYKDFQYLRIGFIFFVYFLSFIYSFSAFFEGFALYFILLLYFFYLHFFLIFAISPRIWFSNSSVFIFKFLFPYSSLSHWNGQLNFFLGMAGLWICTIQCKGIFWIKNEPLYIETLRRIWTCAQFSLALYLMLSKRKFISTYDIHAKPLVTVDHG